VVIYYLLPLDHSSTPVAVTTLVIGLVVFIGLIVFQVRSIMGSQFPGLRAIEALATSVPLFLLLFAGAYVVMAAISRQLRRAADAYGRAVLHRHRVLNGRVRRYHG